MSEITKTTGQITAIEFSEVWVNGIRRIAHITLDNGLTLKTRPGRGAGDFSPLMVGETITIAHRDDTYVCIVD